MKTHRHSNPDGATLTLRKTASAETTPLVDPLLSSQIGDFTVEERIGAGGMGVVYRATHSLIGKQAAIKVLRAELVSPRVHERLLVEARAVNAIRHPGIIDIFGFGKLPDGRPYVVMELLEGRPLSELMSDQKRLDVPTVLWMLDQILSALGAAHRAGVVHRDLKPANVFMVESPNAAPTIKLVDFGIAKLLENRESPTTLDGSVLGTPEFMAPEQIRGGTVGPATDLYALGIMAFQMLTGVRPFQGDPVQVLFAHVDKVPPLPSSRAEGIPPELDTLVLQLLAKDPALRPPSAEAVQQQLQRVPAESRTQPFARPPGLKPKASTQRQAPVSKPAEARVPPRAPVAAAGAEDSGTETLQTLRRPLHRGWMLGGAALLVGLGTGAWWLSHPVAPDEAVPTQIAPKPELKPKTEPTNEVRVEQSTPETLQDVATTVPARSKKEEEPAGKVGDAPPEHEEEGSHSQPSRTGRTIYKPKVATPSLPEPIPAVTPEQPIVAQGKATVTDVTESEGKPFVAPTAPSQTATPTPAPVVSTSAAPRAAMPELPRDTSTQKALADRLTKLFNKVHAPSPKGSPPKELLDDLMWLMRQATNASTATERTDVTTGAYEWEKRFDQWRELPAEAPIAIAPSLVGPPKPRPAPASPSEQTSGQHPLGPLPELRRTTPQEARLANRVEYLTREFLRRTAGARSSLDMEWQLLRFHERASQELTATERMALQQEMDKWFEELKTRYAL
ncbi:serine/threonine protein kinase [Corallococcus sp. CA049B]|uniref:serine/threonine-protein kinase n=1 Tax=Corallococcus sp. CA049B TaxID=2316730 RepID=UPI000EA339C8|nr:serine/threonine-protein kinase [Corallococcus sp. CA049B]RKG84323.1 serine/threonine protein kinase [Corallococcus sp. CA049B]